MKFIALLIASAAAYSEDYNFEAKEKHTGKEKYNFTKSGPYNHYDTHLDPYADERLVHELAREADEERIRMHYIDMMEMDQEDYDADLWAEQLLAYELNDSRDMLEGDMSVQQDAVRAEFDDWWETYLRRPHYSGSYSYGNSYGYAPYHQIDVRETLLKTNVLWNADVLAARQNWRDMNEASRVGHRDDVAAVIAQYEAEIEALEHAMRMAKESKRADVAQINAELRAEVAAITAASHEQVDEINYKHNDLTLELLEAYDTYGDHADVKLILTHHGEGGIELYHDYEHHDYDY